VVAGSPTHELAPDCSGFAPISSLNEPGLRPRRGSSGAERLGKGQLSLGARTVTENQRRPLYKGTRWRERRNNFLLRTGATRRDASNRCAAEASTAAARTPKALAETGRDHRQTAMQPCTARATELSLSVGVQAVASDGKGQVCVTMVGKVTVAYVCRWKFWWSTQISSLFYLKNTVQ
jgi:hypothetical protein